jgi:uncharacterized delta-60 repeat protein
VYIQSDGKILIGGPFTTVNDVSRNFVARLNSDGTLDTGFNPSVNNSVASIATQSDGKIILGGAFTTIGGVTRNRIARLNSDGTLDSNFLITTDRLLEDSVIQPDGKILIVGRFQNISGTSRNRIVRIKEVVNSAPYKLAYTVPENTNVVLKNIFVTNHNDFPVFHDIAILPESETSEGISEKHYYVWDSVLDERSYNKVESSATLSPGDEVYVYSSTDENISFNIFGVEISE